MKLSVKVLGAAGLAASLILVGCAGQPQQGRADLACKNGIATAYDELSFARSQGFSGSVAWSKAASLLGSAKVLEQVENYSQCIDNVEKARFYIRQSQGS
ncbi:hypothetical protein [Pontibacterium sp.]|uniref:hypothetical protein n=1 Tax=Pontibacterium sp. TaxID=2036026 RepID=UPI00351655BA